MKTYNVLQIDTIVYQYTVEAEDEKQAEAIVAGFEEGNCQHEPEYDEITDRVYEVEEIK